MSRRPAPPLSAKRAIKPTPADRFIPSVIIDAGRLVFDRASAPDSRPRYRGSFPGWRLYEPDVEWCS